MLVTKGTCWWLIWIDFMLLCLSGKPFVYQFDNKDVNVVGKSVDGASQTQPINQIASRRGPWKFLAKVRAHVARAIGVAYGLGKFVGDGDIVGCDIDGVVFEGTGWGSIDVGVGAKDRCCSFIAINIQLFSPGKIFPGFLCILMTTNVMEGNWRLVKFVV